MIETNPAPFPVLSTERLILRQPERSDAQSIFFHRNDDLVNIYLEDFRHTTIEQTYALIDRIQKEAAFGKTIFWVITEKGVDKFIGAVSLWNISKEECKAEAGYTLNSAFHQRGFMSEAFVKVIDFGFNTMKLKEIDAYTHENNEASIRLLLKNNFKQGTPKKTVSNNRVFFSLANVSLL